MGRGLAFWNDTTIALVRENFIAAAVPTWTARADSPEGEFLRSAGIDEQWVTSSGYMTCISASGKPLGRQPTPEVLANFQALPASERGPGAVQIAALPPDKSLTPSPPEGGLVLQVHARFLADTPGGSLRHATIDDFPLIQENPNRIPTWKKFLQPNTEYLWLTAAEENSLLPLTSEPGHSFTPDPAIATRLARFHLNPKRATTSEGGIIAENNIRAARLGLTVTAVDQNTITMLLHGHVHWGSAFDPDKATTPDGPLPLGYATDLDGRLEYDRTRKQFTRIDIVAPGHVWGRWGDANNHSLPVERPGSSPFAFALELASPSNNPSHRIPPGGNARTVTGGSGYFPGAR